MRMHKVGQVGLGLRLHAVPFAHQVGNRLGLKFLLRIPKDRPCRDIELSVWSEMAKKQVSEFVRERGELDSRPVVAVDVSCQDTFDKPASHLNLIRGTRWS